jgi:hypothetical protein
VRVVAIARPWNKLHLLRRAQDRLRCAASLRSAATQDAEVALQKREVVLLQILSFEFTARLAAHFDTSTPIALSPQPCYNTSTSPNHLCPVILSEAKDLVVGEQNPLVIPQNLP